MEARIIQIKYNNIANNLQSNFQIDVRHFGDHGRFASICNLRGIIERDPDEPVAAQMFRAVRGRLRVVLDGGRRGVRKAETLESRATSQVRTDSTGSRRARAATVRARIRSLRPSNESFNRKTIGLL